MTPLDHKVSQRISIQSLLVFGIGLIALALWMLPALAGSGSPWDPFVCAAWPVVLICLLMLNYRRALREETQARTVYLDCEHHKLYNERIGVVPYRNGCHLAQIMGSCFAEEDSSKRFPMPRPDEFQLSAIIRSTAFDSLKNSLNPTCAFKNITVREWSGVIELVETDRTIAFSSLGELEDLLCPRVLADAISIVGYCPDTNLDECLCNERMIRGTHGSVLPSALPYTDQPVQSM